MEKGVNTLNCTYFQEQQICTRLVSQYCCSQTENSQQYSKKAEEEIYCFCFQGLPCYQRVEVHVLKHNNVMQWKSPLSNK